jgi:hypothetical protein
MSTPYFGSWLNGTADELGVALGTGLIVSPNQPFLGGGGGACKRARFVGGVSFASANAASLIESNTS